MAYPARFSVAGDSGQGIRRGARHLGNACAHARPQYGEGRNRVGDLGRRSKTKRPTAVETARRCARRNLVRRVDWYSAERRTIDRQRGKRTRGRIPADQNQSEAGTRVEASRGAAEALAADTADGGREFSLSFGGCAAAEAA